MAAVSVKRSIDPTPSNNFLLFFPGPPLSACQLGLIPPLCSIENRVIPHKILRPPQATNNDRSSNRRKIHAARLLGQRCFKENSKWRKKMVESSLKTRILLSHYIIFTSLILILRCSLYSYTFWF